MALIPERSINDMTSPDLNQQALCIEYPDLEVDFELKSGLIHLLPTFRGLAGEDPHKHLKEFHVVCSRMRPQGISEEQVKLRAFPFSLADQAKDWLYLLPSGSTTRWNDLKKQFLEKYFPASRATTIRKEISGIRQFAGESLFEYWERFNRLVESFPHHQIPNHLLIQYFYEGLSNMDRKLIDAASGGALFDKTPTEARKLISTMASNTQQFGVRHDDPPRKSNEVSNLEKRLNQRTTVVEKVIADTYQQVKACGICTLTGHATDMCPTLQESTTEHADAIEGFAGQQQRRYDPFSKTYNPGWRDHSNLSYESQISQLASSVGKLESQGKLPSQSVINPRQNASAITLRSGKELQEHVKEDDTKRGHDAKRKPEKEIEVQQEQTEHEVDHLKPLVTRPPFPERFTKAKKEEEEKEIFETFRKVEVNIPLLDAIKQIPRYAKFLKELCTSKGKLKGNERVSMGENVSAILQRKLPQKCKDPGTFSIPCKIGMIGIKKAMCDLGASINVMPLTIFESLKVGPLKETGVVIQLADRSVVYPEGVLEDVLVQVNELVFPADFYVLDMREDNSPNSTSILLGRPFLKRLEQKSMCTVEVSLWNSMDSIAIGSEDHAPALELKELPKHLKYAFLGENKTLLVIISSKLTDLEEEKLIRVLREFREAIGWTIADIKGLSPSTCMHRILLEEGAKPSREEQRRLNPLMMEVVKKEILKLLDAGMIFPISDSEWVSPTQVVPKKTGITVIENSVGNLVPTRVQNGWRVCIDYRKLNAATRKDHFPLPFIDQMLERLAGQSHYCCLDGYSGFHQIPVAPEDQEKTTFTCSFGTFAYRRMPFGPLQRTPLPSKDVCVREIRSFLGHAGFYRRFIKDFSKIAQPLCALLQKDVTFTFDEECMKAFDKLKDSLTSAPVIRPPDWNHPFEIMCDASNHAIGAVLGQKIGKDPHVIYYASRMLDNAQSNYTTTEKELLAIVFALEKFRHYLLGTKVVVYSDHAALRYLLSKKEAKPRLIRWILLLQEFNLTIKGQERGREPRS
ncbi:UNVERIFIED_CONTAM: Retrovirus-related Pol polyprotein from transposon 17.6 [Sesamum indicum]